MIAISHFFTALSLDRGLPALDRVVISLAGNTISMATVLPAHFFESISEDTYYTSKFGRAKNRARGLPALDIALLALILSIVEERS